MKDKRSYNMSRIRGEDTRPEMWLRKRLHAQGVRYRLHDKHLPGKPDLVFRKYHAVIFVNGCFWHMHQCRFFQFPASSSTKGRGPQWWRKKLIGNRQRDLENIEKCRELGWRVLLLWECALKGRDRLPEPQIIEQITLWLESGSHYLEIPFPDNV